MQKTYVNNDFSLTPATVPTCLQASTIPPIAKKPATDCPSHYKPITFTSAIMKCLEQLVSQHIRTCLPPSLDPHQFTYSANQSTENTVAVTLHRVMVVTRRTRRDVRMLFVDHSSVFIPDILITKLTHLQIPTCIWIKHFLTVCQTRPPRLSVPSASCAEHTAIYTVYP